MVKALLLLIYNVLLGIYAGTSVGMKKELFFLIIGLAILWGFGAYLLRHQSSAVFALMLMEVRGLIQCGNGFEGIIDWYKDIAFFVSAYSVVVMLVKTWVIQRIYQNKIVGILLVAAIPVLLVITYLHGPVSDKNNARLYLADGIMTFPVVLTIFPFVVALMLHKNGEMTVTRRKRSLPLNQFGFIMYCFLILVLSGANDDMGIAAVLVLAGFLTFFLYARNWFSRITIMFSGIAALFLAVRAFRKVRIRWEVFANLRHAANSLGTVAGEAALFVFENRILQHSGLFGLGIGSTRNRDSVYRTLKYDYVFEKIMIELGIVFGIIVLVLLAALLFSMLKLPAVNAFDEVLNLAVVMVIFITCMVSTASSLNCIPPIGIPFLGLADGHSLFMAFGTLLAIHDGIKRRALRYETIYD